MENHFRNEAKNPSSVGTESQSQGELSVSFTPEWTPGPWSVNTTTVLSWDRDFKVWGPEGPSHGLICRTFGAGIKPSPKEARIAAANARLIAAAPALYAALKELRKRHDAKAVAVNFDYCGCDDCKDANAALAAAEKGSK